MKTKKVVIAIALFSLVLSSCKGCPHKEKDKNKTNPVVRVDENTPKSKVEEYLKAKGADDAEIRQMLKIEKEDFGEDIGHIVYENNHYYYEGHDNGWTHCNCGLYAMKRLLFVLGKHDIVDKDLWYRYTDSQLREMCSTPDQSEHIIASILRTLMEDLGVPAEHNKIYDRDGDDISTGGDARTPSESIVYWTAAIEQARQDQDGGRERMAREAKERMEEFKVQHTEKMNRLLNR
ncbi:hypothetical protein AGMMS49990_09330 [Endomicrobiia bacterium]|nr:hypothetical protein AGMMS49990_09330 [Endomicrobiia bacterium]